MKQYFYIPPIGRHVKLTKITDYAKREINTWAWLEVLSVINTPDRGTFVELDILNGKEKTGRTVMVPVSEIEPPIGWVELYTIYCKPDEVQKVLSWLPRGINVRASHDLSSAGRMAFQPADGSEEWHWQFVERTDTVPPEEVKDRIRIVEYTDMDVTGMPSGKNGTRTRKLRKAELEKDGWNVNYIGQGFYQAHRERIIKDFGKEPNDDHKC